MYQKFSNMFKGLLLLLGSAWIGAANAATVSDSTSGNYSQVSLLSVPATPGQPDHEHRAVLHISLQPDWHTYWRTPGDIGIPPYFDFSKSENLDDIKLLWPSPNYYKSFDSGYFGYEEEMTLPIQFTAKDPNKPVVLSLSLNFGVCNHVCVPEMAILSINTENEVHSLPRALKYDQIARRNLPKSARLGGVESVKCKVDNYADGKGSVRIELQSKPGSIASNVDRVTIEPAQSNNLRFGSTNLEREGEQIIISASLRNRSEGKTAPEEPIRVTLFADNGAVDIESCPLDSAQL